MWESSPIIPAAIQILTSWKETYTQINVKRTLFPILTPDADISSFYKINT